MPLGVKLHVVPHLKALISGEEPFTCHGHGSIFTKHKTVLQSTHFTSYRGYCAVCYALWCMKQELLAHVKLEPGTFGLHNHP